MRQTETGFTLIEMSIVLVIIGLLVGGLIIPLAMQVELQRVKETERRLEMVKESLMGYAILNNRLPCPDDDTDGISLPPGSGSGKCKVALGQDREGVVPWKDLGLSQSQVKDAWGGFFRYRVDAAYRNTAVPNAAPADTISNLRLYDVAGNALTDETGSPPKNSPLVAILFSCGKNGRAEGENNNHKTIPVWQCSSPLEFDPKDGKYAQNIYQDKVFDDILIFISKNTLINRLVIANRWSNP